MLWSVESCSPMDARASSFAQGTFLAFRRTRCTVINTFMGWHGSLQYTECIQWHLYEAVQIWRLRVPLEIGRNLFRLEFPLWALCVVNSPRFCLLYKASWEDYLPQLRALKSCRSSKFFPLSWTKNAAWTMGVAVEAKEAEAKDSLILHPDKKENSLPTTRNCS